MLWTSTPTVHHNYYSLDGHNAWREDMVQDGSGLHKYFGLQPPNVTTYSCASLAWGFFAWGSHTAGITVFHCISTCTGKRCLRPHLPRPHTANNRHGHQRLRHAAECHARCYTRQNSFACSYRLSGKSEQRCSFSRPPPEGHALTDANEDLPN